MKQFKTRTGQIRGRVCAIFAISINILNGGLPLWIRILVFLVMLLGLTLVFMDTINIDKKGLERMPSEK